MSLFGPIVSAHRVEAQIADTIKLWAHEYIGEAERQNGVTVNTIPRPVSVRRTSGQAIEVSDHLLPRMVLRSSGWDDPASDGQDASIRLAVTVTGFWKGGRDEETLDRIRVVEAAIRTLLWQKTAGGLIADVTVDGGDYGAVDPERENTLAGFEIDLVVLVQAASRIVGGPTAIDPPPSQPPAPPTDYGDGPTVTDDETVNPAVTAIPVPADQEFTP